jgi:putative FmdB family regulatory protein
LNEDDYMPIYEYRCKECQQVFEEWCKHIEDEKTRHTCPICRGEAERLISHTSFALKGGGWYVTEYGSHKGKETEYTGSGTNTGGAGAAEAAKPCATAGACATENASGCASCATPGTAAS